MPVRGARGARGSDGMVQDRVQLEQKAGWGNCVPTNPFQPRPQRLRGAAPSGAGGLAVVCAGDVARVVGPRERRLDYRAAGLPSGWTTERLVRRRGASLAFVDDVEEARS
jgi:hypothetical protein